MRHRWQSTFLATLAVAFALVSGVLYAGYQHDRAVMSRLAAELQGGRSLSGAELLQAYVDFAHFKLRRPTLAEIEPWPVRLYYQYNPLHPSAAEVLRYGCDYRGPCGSSTRVVVTLLQASGVPSRSLFLFGPDNRHDHTVVEARVDGRWVVVDPAFGVVMHRRDGVLATAADLAADPAFYHAQVDTIHDYVQSYSYESTANFNWHKVPVVLPALRRMLVQVLGEDHVRDIVRPGLAQFRGAFFEYSAADPAGDGSTSQQLRRPHAGARTPAVRAAARSRGTLLGPTARDTAHAARAHSDCSTRLGLGLQPLDFADPRRHLLAPLERPVVLPPAGLHPGRWRRDLPTLAHRPGRRAASVRGRGPRIS